MIKQRYGGIYSDGVKKRFRGFDEVKDMEIEGVIAIKKCMMGEIFRDEYDNFIVAEVGVDQFRLSL